MQFVFLAKCRDPSQTRHAVQRFLDWLEQSFGRFGFLEAINVNALTK